MVYLGVIVLALLATIIFCMAFLFFYRDGNVFGIKYISTKEMIYAYSDEDLSGAETIKIVSGDYPVELRVSASLDEIAGAMSNRVFGYAHQSNIQASFSVEYDSATKTVVFSGTEPEGWLNKSGSNIQVAIPEKDINKGYNIIIETKKGNININNEDLFTLGKIKINSTKGDVNFENISFSGDVITNIGSGNLNVDTSCETVDDINWTVGVDSGDINLAEINSEKFFLNSLKITKNTKGRIYVLKAESVSTDGILDSGGRLYIREVSYLDLAMKDTYIKINKIVGTVQSRIRVSGNGDVEIDSVGNSVLLIEGYNGDVNIASAIGAMSISTNQGAINIADAVMEINAITNYGDINIKFNENAWNYTEGADIKSRFVTAITDNGHINIDGLQRGVITANDKGRITLNYNKVVGDNVIKANSGAVNIVIPAAPINAGSDWAVSLKLNTEVNADVEAGVVKWHGYGNAEFTNIYNETSVSTSNILNVTASTGIVNIRSEDLI